MKELVIALVGQPNVGKSMLINSIADARLKVGNFSGVTVEKAEVRFSAQEHFIKIVDLPGTYSLNDYTQDEKVTKDFLENEPYDLIINVVDATNLERNLYLTTQLLELDKKMIVALNMMDEAQKEGICVDHEQLSSILGVPCVKVSASTKKGIGKLLNRSIDIFNFPHEKSKLIYSDVVEEEIEKLSFFLKQKRYKTELAYRDLVLKLLQNDPKIYQKMHDEPIWLELSFLLKEALEHLYLHHETKDVSEIFAEERASFARGVVTEVLTCKKSISKTITEKIDALLIHKIFGIPIFIALMWALFQLTFELGSIPMDWINLFFVSLGTYAKTIFGDGELGSMIADGAISGVGAVVMFLPNIVILFFGISLLETTGYMARVAFLLDGFFHRFGLHGKSFIPLVTGFGCSVPAYMSARTLKNNKDRLITLFIIGFMSCGAKLPVYVLFSGAFFAQEHAGNVLFLIYISGALIGLIAAKFLKVFVFKGVDEPFVMEMPKYRLPSMRLIWHTVVSKAIMYLKKAGTFILGASLLIWFASNYPKYPDIEKTFAQKIELAQSAEAKIALENEKAQQLLEKSFLGMLGKSTDTLFQPIGFDWKMTVALESGLAAKEVVVSTLGVLYALGAGVDEGNESLIGELQKQIPFASAVSFIIFVMFYLPCMAASIVFTKETGSYKYLFYLFIFTTVVAWGLAFVGYRIALLW
ncbi:ferrous iron transport protein B [Sulfurospirillum diekertiae]|uniref:Ferrous iron transport protein B n=1 Tax=Sulfurospirillum diekertiae TaxID=1854492 RepID=A0A1Y0HPA6_9BACT|nr:ferrous iron transport protein B [Sulfurospirillum diekertiae]ARU49204.1 Fe(2+) transporter FeoB [Sulfurospirillum diekertiae]ASC94014.1 Fe(2+) transporter FeoB [Sulfurospirillum diekertiae]